MGLGSTAVDIDRRKPHEIDEGKAHGIDRGKAHGIDGGKEGPWDRWREGPWDRSREVPALLGNPAAATASAAYLPSHAAFLVLLSAVSSVSRRRLEPCTQLIRKMAYQL